MKKNKLNNLDEWKSKEVGVNSVIKLNTYKLVKPYRNMFLKLILGDTKKEKVKLNGEELYERIHSIVTKLESLDIYPAFIELPDFIESVFWLNELNHPSILFKKLHRDSLEVNDIEIPLLNSKKYNDEILIYLEKKLLCPVCEGKKHILSKMHSNFNVLYMCPMCYAEGRVDRNFKEKNILNKFYEDRLLNFSLMLIADKRFDEELEFDKNELYIKFKYCTTYSPRESTKYIYLINPLHHIKTKMKNIKIKI